jgi:rRNA maturation RNase YbeY
VISFVNSDGDEVNGEVYISVDTVKRNASVHKVPGYEEVIRVMIHGTLHLCGYRDGSEEEREYMIKKQEMQLNEFRRIL